MTRLLHVFGLGRVRLLDLGSHLVQEVLDIGIAIVVAVAVRVDRYDEFSIGFRVKRVDWWAVGH